MSSSVIGVVVGFGLYFLVSLLLITGAVDGGGVCAIVVIFVVVLIGLNVLALLTSSCAVDCVVRALLSPSSRAVDCGAVCAVDVIVGVFRIGLYGLDVWLLLSSCPVDCGGGGGVIVGVFVGVISLYVRVLFSVIASSTGGLSAALLASSISCCPLTCLNDSR